MNLANWPIRTIGEVCDKPQYGYTASSTTEPVGPRFLRITDLREGNIEWNAVPFCKCEEGAVAKFGLQRGDLVVARIGATTGKTSIIINPPEVIFASYLIRLRANQSVNPFFLYFFTQSSSYKAWIDGNKDNNLKGGVNATLLSEIEVPMPPQATQQKIAAVLWKSQQAIEAEEKLIATTRELKQAAMRQLFTRGLRGELQKETDIGMVPASWDVVPLGTLGKIGNGSTPLKGNIGYWANGSIPWLTSAKVYDVTIVKADQFVTPKAVQECHLPMVKPGGVLMAITGQGKTLGHVAVTAIETCVNQHIAYIQFYDDHVVPHYIRLFLESRYRELRGVAQAGGSTKGALTCGFLKGYIVPLPSDEKEQAEIADILLTMEKKISLHERKRATLQELFQTLLHQLMTGQLRVDKLDIDVSEVRA